MSKDTRCLLLLQKTSSQEVLISFVMFTNEYKDSCTISYLEGVDSMPDLVRNGVDNDFRRKLRGAIFQSVILFYLDFVKDHRSIRWCNLFASSPNHGTECYIFNHRPNPCLLPKKQRQMSLIARYNRMISMGQKLGIVKRRVYIDEALLDLIKTSQQPLIDMWMIDPDFWLHVPDLIE